MINRDAPYAFKEKPAGGIPFSPPLNDGRPGILRSFVQTAFECSDADLAAWFTLDSEGKKIRLKQQDCRGIYPLPETLPASSGWTSFLLECREMAVLNNPAPHPLSGLLLHEKMRSGIALPMFKKNEVSDIVILNSRKDNHFGSSNCCRLIRLSGICSNLIK